jgi:hypothetical protein
MTDKPFRIEKRQVYEAYKAVKSNHGAAGVDGQTLEMFEKDLARNLYRIWNRMVITQAGLGGAVRATRTGLEAPRFLDWSGLLAVERADYEGAGAASGFA